MSRSLRYSRPASALNAKSRSLAVAVDRRSLVAQAGISFAILFALTSIFVVTGLVRGADREAAGGSESGEAKESLAILAGGCFWCTEAVFERMEGVTDVVSGYIGGRNANPTYQQVCTGKTGHAEAVQVFYDPSKTSYQEILKVFFKTHDPTTLNRQGVDTGTQYRSSVFYLDEEQKKIAADYIKELDEHGEFRNPIVTKLERAGKFYPAEEYHQDYFRRNPNAGYCQRVVADKVRKFNRTFGDKIKEELK
ncbi:peptide-methionine (S)-S-oxide reductase MsrA [Aporhodopirellula aestuarii]|uniref:Peptide methionine sulfoxide reductase MsrA n=1 Tax=Aporhodopirellula aestuarii TaxID=2950107 RepID=A0ABT0U7L3_9BACT|nr:peptide-methionine (S)-S-oxide reductase MsrA [Aporhodopirellula aestuarii]MCM2372797.1 peptide-methionine (S)-S-oxide reductase MsrA [Aporhodopirellula aestuarii]